MCLRPHNDTALCVCVFVCLFVCLFVFLFVYYFHGGMTYKAEEE